jgi:hypothetical protein
LPDHVFNPQTSDLESHSSKGSAPASGVKGPDGTIFAGHCPNWNDIPKNKRSLVCKERKCLGPAARTGDKKTCRSKPSVVKTKKKTLAKLTREIASLKTKMVKSQTKHCTSSEDDAANHAKPQDDTINLMFKHCVTHCSDRCTVREKLQMAPLKSN